MAQVSSLTIESAVHLLFRLNPLDGRFFARGEAMAKGLVHDVAPQFEIFFEMVGGEKLFGSHGIKTLEFAILGYEVCGHVEAE